MNTPIHPELGIVQGRLIQSPPGQLQWFPKERWEEEFQLAAQSDLNYIELIAERTHNEENPIWSDSGIEKIKFLSEKHGLNLCALCNDYVIDNPLLDDSKSIEQTFKLIERTSLLGIQKFILPMFEKSEMNENNWQNYSASLREISSVAEKHNILVCLETILDGSKLVKVLESLSHPNIKCVFDTGNRIAFDQDIYSDIILLGNHIQHVHIKDKDEENNNVLLGTGKVNFKKVFESLVSIDYCGPYTFETHRGKDPIRTVRYNKTLTEFFYNEAF